MARSRTHRPPVALAPLLISQLNCEAALGIDPRRYLELFVPHCREHAVTIGKLRVLPADVVLDAVRRLARETNNAVAGPSDTDGDDDVPTTASEVLSRLGLVLTKDRKE